jgi:DNA-directed RNA polymerase subunit N (RpoN/RPB10)
MEEVVEKAPNLTELQISWASEPIANGASSRILDQVARLTQLQAFDAPNFHCSGQLLAQFARQMPNLRYTQNMQQSLKIHRYCCTRKFAFYKDLYGSTTLGSNGK